MIMKRVKVIMNMRVMMIANIRVMMIANIRVIKVVIIRMKIVYINVLTRLVSITPGHVKLD